MCRYYLQDLIELGYSEDAAKLILKGCPPIWADALFPSEATLSLAPFVYHCRTEEDRQFISQLIKLEVGIDV